MTRTAHSNIDALIKLRENNALPIVSVWAVEFAVMVSKWTTHYRTRSTGYLMYNSYSKIT